MAIAHRQVATLVADGYRVATGGGRHIAGPRLRGLLALVDDKQLIANVAAPLLHRLAAKAGVLARELDQVARQGFAQDRGEIDPDLSCIAVPIRRPDGIAPAAISISRLNGKSALDPDALLIALQNTAHDIENLCFLHSLPWVDRHRSRSNHPDGLIRLLSRRGRHLLDRIQHRPPQAEVRQHVCTITSLSTTTRRCGSVYCSGMAALSVCQQDPAEPRRHRVS